MTPPRDIVERLRRLSALNLRCVRMQIDDREPIYAEAADAITSLRQRAEVAEQCRRNTEIALVIALGSAISATARIAELEAALAAVAALTQKENS